LASDVVALVFVFVMMMICIIVFVYPVLPPDTPARTGNGCRGAPCYKKHVANI
jgi:hypothetical protein